MAKTASEEAVIKRDEAFALEVEQAKEKEEDVPTFEDLPEVKEVKDYEKLKQELVDIIEYEEALDEDEQEIHENLGQFMKHNK